MIHPPLSRDENTQSDDADVNFNITKKVPGFRTFRFHFEGRQKYTCSNSKYFLKTLYNHLHFR